MTEVKINRKPKHYKSISSIHRSRKDHGMEFKRDDIMEYLIDEGHIHYLDEESAKERGQQFGGYYLTSKGDKYHNGELAEDEDKILASYEYNVNGRLGSTIYVRVDAIPQFLENLMEAGVKMERIEVEDEEDAPSEKTDDTKKAHATQSTMDLKKENVFESPEPNPIQQGELPVSNEGLEELKQLFGSDNVTNQLLVQVIQNQEKTIALLTNINQAIGN